MMLIDTTQIIVDTSQRWVMYTSAIIQILIFVAIAVTCGLAYRNLRQQQKSMKQQEVFNRNSLRPWLYAKPTNSMTMGNGFIQLFLNLRNVGHSPAMNYLSFLTITQDKKFPVDEYRGTKADSRLKKGFIFPNQDDIIIERKFTKNPDGNPWAGDYKVLAENLGFWAGRLYLHFYIEYYVGQNAYAFQTTYRIDEIKPLISMMVGNAVSYTGECTYIGTLINSSDQRIV